MRRQTKILMLGSSCLGTVDPTAEYAAIERELRHSGHLDDFVLQPMWEVGLSEIANLLRRFQPDILHFSGHGNEQGELVFQASGETPTVADRWLLAEVFRLAGRSVKCVVLNACYSAEQAELIAHHVDAVIGMTGQITQAYAVAFAAGIYEALSFSMSVVEAFDWATTKASSVLGLAPAQAAVLHARPGVNPSEVFLWRSGEAEQSFFEGPGRAAVKQMDSFVGRNAELEALAQLLGREHRATRVVVSGTGGIGKTTLVEQFVATQAEFLFPAGCAWLDAAALGSEVGRLCRRLGWKGRNVPTAEQATEFLARQHRQSRFLIVVDGLDSPSQSAIQMLPQPGPQYSVLLTSRLESLHQDFVDARQVSLSCLSSEACTEILRAEVRHLQDDDFGELAAFVGHLPLGIRLVAAYLHRNRSLTASDALARIRAQPVRELEPRRNQRGLRATFEAAITGLPLARLRTLQALAVCAPDTRLEVVAEVSDTTPADARQALDELRDLSLVDYSSAEQGSWTVQPLLRVFILEQLLPEQLYTRHSKWVETHVSTYSPVEDHLAFSRGYSEVRLELDRRIAAGKLAQALELRQLLVRYLMTEGRFAEAIEINQAVLALAPAGSREAASCIGSIGRCALAAGDLSVADQHLREALAVCRSLRQPKAEAVLLANLGTCCRLRGALAQAVACYDDAIRINRELRRWTGMITDLGHLAQCRRELGQHSRAIEILESARARHEQCDDFEVRAGQLANLGQCYLECGKVQRAMTYMRAALEIYRGIAHLPGEASTLHDLGWAHERAANRTGAREWYSSALAIERELGPSFGRSQRLERMAVFFVDSRMYAEATACMEIALAPEERTASARRSEGQDEQLRYACTKLGEHFEAAGEPQAALRWFEAAVTGLPKPVGACTALRRVADHRHGIGELGEFIAHLEQMDWPEGDRQYAAEGYWEVADHFRDCGDVDGALEFFVRALRTGSWDTKALAELRREIGACHLDRGNYDTAAGILTQAMQGFADLHLHERQTQTASKLGRCWEEQGNYQSALEQYEFIAGVYALQRDSASEAHTQRKIARCLLALGRRNDAQKAIARADDLDRRSGGVVAQTAVLEHLALAYSTLGLRQKEARLRRQLVGKSRTMLTLID